MANIWQYTRLILREPGRKYTTPHTVPVFLYSIWACSPCYNTESHIKNIKIYTNIFYALNFIFIIHVYPIVIAIMHNIKFTRKLPNWIRILASIFALFRSLSQHNFLFLSLSFRLLITYSTAEAYIHNHTRRTHANTQTPLRMHNKKQRKREND